MALWPSSADSFTLVCERISYILKAYYCNIRHLNVYNGLLFPSSYRISSMLGSTLFTIVAISSERKYADVTLIYISFEKLLNVVGA